jgi:hypothetical protein
MNLTFDIGVNLCDTLIILGVLVLIGFLAKHWWMTYAIVKAGRS